MRLWRWNTDGFFVEMRSSGPWPETEINTTSGNEANVCAQYSTGTA